MKFKQLQIIWNKINWIIFALFLIVLSLVLWQFWQMIYQPVYNPQASELILSQPKLKIKNNLFNQVINDLNARPNKLKQALEKEYPDPFK